MSTKRMRDEPVPGVAHGQRPERSVGCKPTCREVHDVVAAADPHGRPALSSRWHMGLGIRKLHDGEPTLTGTDVDGNPALTVGNGTG